MYNANTLAIAKLVENKKLKTLRLLVTFDKSKRDSKGNVTVTVQNAIFKSGDICSITENREYKQYIIAKTLRKAAQELRTENIVFV